MLILSYGSIDYKSLITFVQRDGHIIYQPYGQTCVNECLKYVTKDGVITAKYPGSGFRSGSVFDKQGHVLQFDDDKICVRSMMENNKR